jgi:hypothetical protein
MDPTNQHDEGDERYAGDLLVGARAIRDFLVWLGRLSDEDGEDDVYYLKRTGRWPIGTDGGNLIASKRRLTRHAQKITAPAA